MTALPKTIVTHQSLVLPTTTVGIVALLRGTVSTWTTRLAWSLLVAITGWRCVDIALFDFRSHPVSGDQTNFVMQAQSLLHGANLLYDADDLRRWAEFGWADKPYGLFFRTVEDGWVFAKPYGYSAYLVPFMWLFGDLAGIAIGNAVLLAAMTAVVVALLRLRLSGFVVPVLAVAFVFMSANQFYGWVVHTELFLATLVGVACWFLIRHRDSGVLAHALAGTAVAAFLFSEKATMAFVLGPLIAVVLIKMSNWQRRLVTVGAGVAATVLFVSPYLWYSGGEHWNPYQGERYYSRGEVQFGGPVSDPSPAWNTAPKGEFFGAGVIQRIAKAPEAAAQSALTTVAGRHTGLLVFAPLSLFVLARAVRRWRTMSHESRGLFVGVVAYLILYVLITPRYYIGGASLGNRYFVQISTAVVALLALDPPRRATATKMASLSALLSMVLIWPHHLTPRNAYSERLHVTTPLQRLFPPETQLSNWELFNK